MVERVKEWKIKQNEIHRYIIYNRGRERKKERVKKSVYEKN